MNTVWPTALFSDFIKLRKQFITIHDNKSYERVTVQLYARGIIKRDVVFGSSIKTKKQQVIKAYDLLIAEIDAKVGGFGIVPPELDGAIVSSHYFTYEVNTNIIDLDYLAYYLQSGRPLEDIQQYVTGSTNYAAIRDYHFPLLPIPLPDMEEQLHLVTLLDTYTSRSTEVLSLLNEIKKEARAAFSVAIDSAQSRLMTDQGEYLSIKDVTTYVQRGITPNYANEGGVFVINQKCVRQEGLQLQRARYLADEQMPKLAQERFLRTGDVLLNSTGEGTLGRSTVVPSIDYQAVTDTHVTVIRANQDLALPGWIDYFLKSTDGQQQIQAKKTGSTKQTELGLSNVLGLKLLVPSIEIQAAIVQDIDKGTSYLQLLFKRLEATMEECQSLVPQFLTRAFTGDLQVTVPLEILEESHARQAQKREYQRQVLEIRHTEAELQEEQFQMEKIEIKEAIDITLFIRQHLNEERRIEAGALWRLLKPSLREIDLFYAFLKAESKAGRIVDVKEDNRVYLELGNEAETVMD